MRAIDLEAEGLPAHLALRIGGHVGPVFPTYDPVLDANGFMGSHVSRTARIEPVTPAGAVYVTEPFAAALVLADRRSSSATTSATWRRQRATATCACTGSGAATRATRPPEKRSSQRRWRTTAQLLSGTMISLPVFMFFISVAWGMTWIAS